MLPAATIAAALCGCGSSTETVTTPKGCGDGILQPELNEECDDGNRFNADGCSAVCMLEVAHTTLTTNIGINREIVPDYQGDSCAGLADLLIIEGTGPEGFQLEHQELDCNMGYNGWPFYDVPAGHYVISMQLFDDEGGTLRPLTQVKTGEGEVLAGVSSTIYVDFTYGDFDALYQGSLKWRYRWGEEIVNDGDTGVGCDQAGISTVRIVVRNDQNRVVNDVTTFGTPTNGTKETPCLDLTTSEAEVVNSLPWGVYQLTLEGLSVTGAVTHCLRRDLFTPNGDGGFIFSVVVPASQCP